MSVKVVVLYPSPTDEQAFERTYHGQHMPLMRKLIEPATRVSTFRIRGSESAPYYRMAEIHFPNLTELYAFASSEGAETARRSSESVSTGGKPTTLVCDADP